jgi:asparagine synthase (glutamine-hydrolysing)
MCGIAGFNWSDKEKIQAMIDSMKNRGPDDSGCFLDTQISLGHRRLSIIELSHAGHQPMLDNEKDLVIVYNGELYNFQELKKELSIQGHNFVTQSDTEVILYAYKEWGPECVNKFKGMFAFAIYDIKKGEIFLARDHVGIKPLYYFKDDARFIFSSVITPLFLHNIKKEPNRKAIRDFLLYNITDHLDETFFKEIKIFPQGHYAIFNLKNRTLKMQKWWENKFTGNFKGTYKDAESRLGTLLKEGINNHLVSDVPVGTCLSGGIDSSAVACLINESKKSAIDTFSAVYPGYWIDESKYIDIVTSNTGMKNHKIKFSSMNIHDDISRYITIMEEPIPGPSPYAQYKVFQLAKEKNITVLLDGQGADELFAGYHYFYGFYIKGLIKKGRILKAAKEIFHLMKNGNSKLEFMSTGFMLSPLSNRQSYFIKASNISKSLLDDSAAQSSYFSDYYMVKNLHEALEFHLNYKLEHLLKWEDRNSMAHSREGRVPFLDVDLMKFVFELPEDFIISQGLRKRLLRDSLKNKIPDEILQRRDKIGFATPESLWLLEETMKKHIEHILTADKLLCEPYIDVKRTRQMIEGHLSKKKDYGRQIWRTIFLEEWLKQNNFGS